MPKRFSSRGLDFFYLIEDFGQSSSETSKVMGKVSTDWNREELALMLGEQAGWSSWINFHFQKDTRKRILDGRWFMDAARRYHQTWVSSMPRRHSN